MTTGISRNAWPLLIPVLLALSGCGPRALVKAPEPVHMDLPAPKVSEGSLWQPDAGPAGLLADHTARNKGDLLTIQIVEDTTAKRGRSLTTNRSQSVDAKANQLVYPTWLQLGNGVNKGLNPAVNGSSTRSSTGNGTIDESGTIRATLSAQVTQVLPNGNLVVLGQKEVIVAGESQVITLTGIARPEDVSAANTIVSAQLAEARINITGSGPLNDAQRRTLVSRIFDWVNLF